MLSIPRMISKKVNVKSAISASVVNNTSIGKFQKVINKLVLRN